jgi:hypothetical protein
MTQPGAVRLRSFCAFGSVPAIALATADGRPFRGYANLEAWRLQAPYQNAPQASHSAARSALNLASCRSCSVTFLARRMSRYRSYENRPPT